MTTLYVKNNIKIYSNILLLKATNYIVILNLKKINIEYYVFTIDVDCGKPEHIQHGRYTLTSNATYYGAAALYECDGNFELDGFARRLCLENATWSSDTPICRGN